MYFYLSSLRDEKIFHSGYVIIHPDIHPDEHPFFTVYTTTDEWRSKAKCRPRPTTKVPPFPPLKLAYKIFKWKFVFRANLRI